MLHWPPRVAASPCVPLPHGPPGGTSSSSDMRMQVAGSRVACSPRAVVGHGRHKMACARSTQRATFVCLAAAVTTTNRALALTVGNRAKVGSPWARPWARPSVLRAAWHSMAWHGNAWHTRTPHHARTGTHWHAHPHHCMHWPDGRCAGPAQLSVRCPGGDSDCPQRREGARKVGDGGCAAAGD
jgi:hypothetical protein